MAKNTSDHSATTAHADTFRSTVAAACREVAENLTAEDCNAVNTGDSEEVDHCPDEIIEAKAITTAAETDVDQGIAEERTSSKAAMPPTAVVVVL